MSTMTSRRAVLAGAATLPALTMPALADAQADDPIFAAIERHRAAWAELERRTSVTIRLENILPPDHRKAHHRDEPSAGEGDDPRWTAAMADWSQASDASEDAAAELLTIKPATVAGVAALLDYGYEFETAPLRAEWGDFFLEGDGHRSGNFASDAEIENGRWLSWKTLVLHHAAEALRHITAASA